MKGIRKIFLILPIVFFLQTPSIASSEIPKDSKLQWQPSEDIHVVTNGKNAFVISRTSGISVLDIPNTADVNQVAHLDFSDEVSCVRIIGSYIYMTTQKNFYVIDISKPQHPIWSFDTMIPANGILRGFETDLDCVYIYDENSIHVFSVKDASKPQFAGSYRVNGTAGSSSISDISARNGIVYAALGYEGMVIFDFTNLNSVGCIGRFNDIHGFCENIYFCEDLAYVKISGATIVEVLDISDIMSPGIIGIIQDICLDRTDLKIAMYHSFALIPDDSNKIHVIDVSDKHNIKESGWVDTAGIPADLHVEGEKAYVFDKSGGISSIDLSKSVSHYVIKSKVPDAVKSKVSVYKNKKTAYITIDDGPSRNNTPRNLDTLNKYGIKATFFVLPKDHMDDLYKRIIDEGHLIGNHSYSHDYNYLFASTENFKKDVIEARDFIYNRFQYTSTVFRFPGGSMGHENSTIKDRTDILAGLGYKYFDWDVSTNDTDPNLKKYVDEEYIVNLLANNVIKGTQNRKKLIILMHDLSDKTYTAKALPKIIEGLQKQGYVFDVLTNY